MPTEMYNFGMGLCPHYFANGEKYIQEEQVEYCPTKNFCLPARTYTVENILQPSIKLYQLGISLC